MDDRFVWWDVRKADGTLVWGYFCVSAWWSRLAWWAGWRWRARPDPDVLTRATRSPSSARRRSTDPPRLPSLASPHIDSAFELKTRIKIFWIKTWSHESQNNMNDSLIQIKSITIFLQSNYQICLKHITRMLLVVYFYIFLTYGVRLRVLGR